MANVTETVWDQRTSWAELCEALRASGDASAQMDKPPAKRSVSGRFVVGRPDDLDAPLVFRTYFPPGQVTPVHSHRVNYSEFIVDGTREITRKWYRAGDIQVATAETFYGPLIAGPGGVLVFAVFGSQRYRPITVEEQRAEPNPQSRPKYFHKTSWDVLYQELPEDAGGRTNVHYVVGAPDDPSSAVVMKTHLPPGAEVPAHTHETAFAHIVVSGTVRDGDQEYRADEIRIATPGAVHGPLVAGPMGVDLVTIFADGRITPVSAAAA
jgi:quercetin dioxygenase-like cupin family protein